MLDKRSEVGQESATFSLEPFSRGRRSYSNLHINGEVYELTTSQAVVAEVLLNTEIPLSIKEIKEQTGYTNSGVAVRDLKEIGIIHAYQSTKDNTRQRAYYLARPQHIQPEIPEGFSPYVSRSENSSPEKLPITTQAPHDLGLDDTETPYIPLPDKASMALIMSHAERYNGNTEEARQKRSELPRAKTYLSYQFEQGNREGFEQAKCGKWVFTGYEEMGGPSKSMSEAAAKTEQDLSSGPNPAA